MLVAAIPEQQAEEEELPELVPEPEVPLVAVGPASGGKSCSALSCGLALNPMSSWGIK